ncbi:hypothetical protein [Acidiferrobacter sp.]|uniref:hypothetical protein n=1 Tax=Acidiferrobacter sp. TaxID=1872107 RepID=UPI002603AE68|nr:hypothetical protein [Acidiferrobacter sp.]
MDGPALRPGGCTGCRHWSTGRDLEQGDLFPGLLALSSGTSSLAATYGYCALRDRLTRCDLPMPCWEPPPAVLARRAPMTRG